MTLVATGSELIWPISLIQGTPAAIALGGSGCTLDSTSDAIAWVGKAWFTDSIKTVNFRTGTVTTGATVDVRIETVTGGRPSGTLWATDTNIGVVIADGDDNVWKSGALTAAASISQGDEFAIVIASSAGTPNMVLTGITGNAGDWKDHYPLLLQNATGAYGTPTAEQHFNWIIELTTAGVVPFPSTLPLSPGGTITAFNSGTSPDERALRFQVPFKCRCRGIRAIMFNIAAGADFTFSLWDASGDTDAEALAQAAEDGDFALSTSVDGAVKLYFDTAVTLEKDTTYYAGVRADTANSISLGEMTATASVTNSVRAFPIPNSGNVYLATRTWTAGTAGAWTETATTTLPLISLIIDQVDDGTGAGGGLLTHPGMGGGMRG